MARLELGEREISLTQSAEDRQNGVWHVWTNDNFMHRRLKSVGAKVVTETENGTTYELDQRQVLLRKVPAKRAGNPGVTHYLRHGKRAALAEMVELKEQ